ncbi:MAG: hypothetical protein E6R11_01300 [Rhodocyclaceae bacterium]|nr:MAG: hypothetical protein E6R11_01300 [Rhodocyclaceae bacterium]
MRAFFLAVSLALASAPALAAEPDTTAILEKASHTFAMTGGELSGPGADLILKATADAQFVLSGEDHFDTLTPQFHTALYRMVHRAHGIDRLVVELDPLAIEGMRWKPGPDDLDQIVSLARRYPTLIGFSSDPDLKFLADVRAISGPKTLWGIEQAQSPARYLEELVRLAPNQKVRADTESLLSIARPIAGLADMGKYVSQAPTLLGRLETLKENFQAPAGSRADVLLTGLAKSTEIYSYYARADAGEPVGLYNNTVREDWMKRSFLARYSAESRKRGAPIKAMFRFGANHMYHGKNPTQAFPIGNLAHELAIVNGKHAYGLYILGLGGYTQWGDLPSWMKPILPASQPTAPLLIDLRPLRPVARYYARQVAEADRWELRDLIQGFDAVVLLPNSSKASWSLTGQPQP